MGITASYTYDVDGLWLSKTVDGKTTKHVWDGNQQLVADVLDSDYYAGQIMPEPWASWYKGY